MYRIEDGSLQVLLAHLVAVFEAVDERTQMRT